jgi:hypothetical protein
MLVRKKRNGKCVKSFFPLARSKPTLLPLQPKKNFSSQKGEEVIQAFNKKKRKFKFWLSSQATVKGYVHNGIILNYDCMIRSFNG